MRSSIPARRSPHEGFQLSMDLKPPARTPRTLALRSYYPSSPAVTVPEALEGERRASGQDAIILQLFQAHEGERFTPSAVANRINRGRARSILLTSIRRSLTGLTKRGLLTHHERDRRPGPYSALESCWSLAE